MCARCARITARTRSRVDRVLGCSQRKKKAMLPLRRRATRMMQSFDARRAGSVRGGARRTAGPLDSSGARRTAGPLDSNGARRTAGPLDSNGARRTAGPLDSNGVQGGAGDSQRAATRRPLKGRPRTSHLGSTRAVLEEQIAIVAVATRHEKNRRNLRRLVFWRRWTRDFRSPPHRFRTTDNRAKRGKARVPCTGNR